MSKKKITRREFVQSSSALFSMSPLLSTLLTSCGKKDSESPGDLIGRLPTGDSRFLVCLVLGGGNDSFNMLVPTSTSHYNEYAISRSNLALNKHSLLPLNNFKDTEGRELGLHESMPELQKLFNEGELSFLANTGPLAEPISSSTVFNQSGTKIPLGLQSHADQFRHLQSATPLIRSSTGWFGRMSDILKNENSNKDISMNISVSGNNLLQIGKESFEYSITPKGSVGIEINNQESDLAKTIFESFNNVLNRSHSDIFEQKYLDVARIAQRDHEAFHAATKDKQFKVKFSEHEVSQQFEMVAKTIAASSKLKMKRQTFFIHYYGWDHHGELLNNHSKMLGVVSKALGEFNSALKEIGQQNNTMTFTVSDFGRTLTSNGNGTDHGWGGNSIVMGAGIKGGRVFGQYPSLALNSSLDIGGGVLIPTTPLDLVYAEIAMWFGIKPNDLLKVIPNLNKFYTINNNVKPIGFT